MSSKFSRIMSQKEFEKKLLADTAKRSKVNPLGIGKAKSILPTAKHSYKTNGLLGGSISKSMYKSSNSKGTVLGGSPIPSDSRTDDYIKENHITVGGNRIINNSTQGLPSGKTGSSISSLPKISDETGDVLLQAVSSGSKVNNDKVLPQAPLAEPGDNTGDDLLQTLLPKKNDNNKVLPQDSSNGGEETVKVVDPYAESTRTQKESTEQSVNPVTNSKYSFDYTKDIVNDYFQKTGGRYIPLTDFNTRRTYWVGENYFDNYGGDRDRYVYNYNPSMKEDDLSNGSRMVAGYLYNAVEGNESSSGEKEEPSSSDSTPDEDIFKVDDNGYIVTQKDLGTKKYGLLGTAENNACGFVATNNALADLGIDADPASLYNDFSRSGTNLGGLLGTNPLYIDCYLNSIPGVSTKWYIGDDTLDEHDTYILLYGYFNSNGTIGMHYQHFNEDNGIYSFTNKKKEATSVEDFLGKDIDNWDNIYAVVGIDYTPVEPDIVYRL